MARVAQGVNPAYVTKAVPIIKKMGDARDAAKFDELQDKLKVARPMAAQILYAAEAVIDPSLKFKATEANVKKARARGLRVERIAAYTGLPVSKIKSDFQDILDATYVGRGKRPNGDNGASASKSKAKPAAEKRGPGRPKGSTNKAKTEKVRRRSALSQRP